jgi:hypothetical protein
MKHFLTIAILLCIISCTQGKSIDGSWIYSYNLDGEGKISFSPISLAIFKFENDNMTEYIIGNEDYGIDNQENVYNIERTGDIFKLGEEYTLDMNTVKGDSLVLKSGDDSNDVSIICKRLPNNYGLKTWNPLNKIYRFKNWKSETIIMEFVSDSTFTEQKENSKMEIRIWESTRLSNYSFFLFTYLEPTPILIDSVAMDRVYATYYGPKINKFVFNEIKKK